MSGSTEFARGGVRGRGMVPPPLGRGMVPLRRGPAAGKEKGRPDEASMKARGLAMKGNTIGASSAGGNSQEEDFQLVSCREQGALPLYAMAIRLTPGLLETLKRVEELGETSNMKFGVNISGHIIKVGEEEFRFSSAPEPGHLCDIFEEQRRGEDGNGLLVESGAVWRKLSVTRTLSATEKDRVKARSVEAERQQKSRKAIILDHNNSLMNNKATTSGDVNGRRAPVMMKPKKEPPQKKRKILANVPVIPPLSAVKTRPMPGITDKPPVPVLTNKMAKTTAASSPPEGPPASLRAPAQGAVVPTFKPKGAAVEEVGALKPTAGSQKDKVSSPALPAAGETVNVTKTAGVVNMTELRNHLITLLVDNPKGMTIKAVEKALGEGMPNVRPDKKQIEKVIKAIASYSAPGRYMLKEGVEKGVFAKPSPGSGSSPETVPVNSPPLADLPALLENVPEMQECRSVGGADRNVSVQQDSKRMDGANRSSALPLQRAGESAMSRAIRKAGEIVRAGERLLPSGQDKPRTVAESPGHKFDDLMLKDSIVRQEMTEADHVSTLAESSATGSPEDENVAKQNGIEMENNDQDLQNQGLPAWLEDNKKENTDGSDSSSSSSSSSGSGSESESESASGSRSGSGSETDSDGSSSSGSEEGNMDEDVDIISDDDEKAGVDVMVEAPKPKSKSKDVRTSLERQESRVQKQPSRGKENIKKQKQKESDTGMTPHGSEDADFGDGAEGGEISKISDLEGTEKGAKGSNSEEEVDVVSCDEDTISAQEQGITSPAESGKHIDHALDSELVEEVKVVGQDNLHASMQTKSDSESDHSIEEYETRAENSGVRGARVKVIEDQKDDSLERRMEGVENVSSPRSKGSIGSKLEETPDSFERESEAEILGLATAMKGSDSADDLVMSKELPILSGISVKSENIQRSLLGTPPMPRDGLDQGGPRTYRDALTKSKAMESKRKGVESTGRSRKNTGESQGKDFVLHGGPQRLKKMVGTSGRPAKLSEASLKSSGDTETPLKTSDGLPKVGEEPGLIGKGPDAYTADHMVKLSRDGDTMERFDGQRRQNRDAGLLGKPGKTGRSKENDQSSGLSRAKQVKKPLDKLDIRRGELSERAGALSELGEKLFKDAEIHRKLPKDGEPWRKSPRVVESGSRVGSDNEVHSLRLKDFQKPDTDQSEAKSSIPVEMVSGKANLSRMSSELELGELRDIVAGDELRAKDSVRNDLGKARENLDLSSRQPNKARISPEKDKPRSSGRQGGDVKKRSPADLKKQQLVKKDLQKVEVPVSLKETARPAFNSKKLGIGHEERLEMASNRAHEVTKLRVTVGDHNEKHFEGKNGKRLPEEGGNHDLGRPSKRAALDPSPVVASIGRGDPDSTWNKQERASFPLDGTGRTSVVDTSKGVSADGGNQLAANSSKVVGENGRVVGPKNKGNDAIDKEVGERRGPLLDGKQKTTPGFLGPGTKRENQSNGKKRSTQVSDGQSREFFAPYEKRSPELKGIISQYDQYLEYFKEYNEKYPVYVRLNTVLESDKEDFEKFSKDITIAKAAEDKNKLGNIYGKLRKDYLQCRKRFKRMQKTFLILHDELRVIKQRCKEYAEKVA